MTTATARAELASSIEAGISAVVSVYPYPQRAGHQTRLPASVTITSVTPATSTNTDSYEAVLTATFDAGTDLSAAYGRADDVLEDVEAALPVGWEAVPTWVQELSSDDHARVVYKMTVIGHDG